MCQRREIHVQARFWIPLVIFFLLLAGQDTASGVDVGQKAADFSLMSTTGNPISLSQFHGKKYVVLEFYVRDFAPA